MFWTPFFLGRPIRMTKNDLLSACDIAGTRIGHVQLIEEYLDNVHLLRIKLHGKG